MSDYFHFDGDFTYEAWFPVKTFNCRCTILPTKETDVTEKSVYHSSTLGDIPLSFTGRHLLANLREAFEDYIKELRTRPAYALTPSWEPVSKARGKLAKYMSQLEAKAERFFLKDVPTDQLEKELASRGFYVTPRDSEVPVDTCVNRLLDAGFTVSVEYDPSLPWSQSRVNVTGALSAAEAENIARRMRNATPKSLLDSLIGKTVVVEVDGNRVRSLNGEPVDEHIDNVLNVLLFGKNNPFR